MTKRTAGQVLYWTLLIALLAYGLRRNGWDAVQVWTWWLAGVGAMLWLRYRLETRLSRLVYTSLVEAVRAQPANTPLVDYENRRPAGDHRQPVPRRAGRVVGPADTAGALG